MIVWWSIGAGVHVEPHSHANEQIVWMLKGKMEFRLGNEQRVCGQGDVVVIPGGTEHEAWFREDTEVIDFFAPPRDDFLLGGKPAYMSEGQIAMAGGSIFFKDQATLRAQLHRQFQTRANFSELFWPFYGPGMDKNYPVNA